MKELHNINIWLVVYEDVDAINAHDNYDEAVKWAEHLNNNPHLIGNYSVKEIVMWKWNKTT